MFSNNKEFDNRFFVFLESSDELSNPANYLYFPLLVSSRKVLALAPRLGRTHATFGLEDPLETHDP